MAYCGPRGIPHSEFLGWDIDDQAKALGWMAQESQRCSECGTFPWDWPPEGDGFEPTVKLCMGCQGRGLAQKENEELIRTTPGIKISLQRPEIEPDAA